MKTILIVAATQAEIAGIQDYLIATPYEVDMPYRFEILITGVGIMAATYAITDYLNKYPIDYLIQVGIAGSFSPKLEIGSIVQVASEAMGDLGAEDGDAYIDIFEMNLLEPNDAPFDNKLLFVPEALPSILTLDLPKVHSLTVNTTSGRNTTIAMRRKKFAAQIETMEGAPFHFVCLQHAKPFVQVRSISNYVTERDTSQWYIKKAIDRLNEWVIKKIIEA